MAWFEKKPDAKPEDKSDGDLLIEKLTGVIDAKLSPINAELADSKKRWESLEASVAAPPKKEPPADPPARISVLDNEDEAFAQRLGPLAYQNAVLSARLTENDIFAEMKESGWSELLPEVRKHLENTPIQRKAQADYQQYVRNVMKMVVGDKALTSGLRMNQSDKTFYLESAKTHTEDGERRLSSELNWSDSKGRVHTGDEVASKLGLDADDLKTITGGEFLQ